MNVRFNSRCAGNVLRYHTWPTIQKQTVADHTFHVLRIYHEVWPNDIDQDVMSHILYHDMSEIATGDIPFPVKKKNSDLKKIMDRLEAEQAEAMGWDTGHEFDDKIRIRIKLCDLCEMYEFAVHERRLGNTLAREVQENVSRAIHEIAYQEPDYMAIFNYMHKVNNT